MILWNIRSQNCSFPRLFVSKVELSFLGMNSPRTIRSGELLFPGTNEPWTFCCSDHSFTGTFVPNYKKSCETVFLAFPGPAVPKSSLISGTVISISTSARCTTSGATSVSGHDSTSGIAAELRSPRTCDLRTMVEVVSARLIVPECVTTGIGENF